jgi:polyisoprenoid-binding protein YceI
MKKSVSALLVIALLPLSAFSATWKGDPAHSRLSFAVTHLGISEITGAFKGFDVLITAEKPDFSDAVFDLSVDVASIDTEVEKRDNHLRSPDFFEVEKFPKMTFRSKSIEPAGKDRYTLSGDLTIRGQTKPVQMELWYRGTTTNQKNTTAGFQLTGKLKRSDFGVGPKFQPPMISEEVAIKADGEFIKQP